jgi:hypothetical protein
LIVDKRFDAIKKVVIENFVRKRDVVIASKLSEILEDFSKKIENEYGYYKLAQNASTNNVRARMQILYLMFLNYIDERTGKGYLVTEHMLLNGHAYPTVAYEYTDSAIGRLVGRPTSEMKSEARFLPLITRYPSDGEESPSDAVAAVFPGIMMGIRIIQLLISAYGIRDRQALPTITELTDLVSRRFGYSGKSVNAFIRELASYEVLRIHIADGFAVESDGNRLSPLPKATYIMSDILFDVAYLNMCCMRTRWNEAAISLKYVTLETLGSDKSDLFRWISIKLRNSIFLFCNMIQMNEYERYNAGVTTISLSQRQENILDAAIKIGMWDFLKDKYPVFATDFLKILEHTSGSVISTDERSEISNSVRILLSQFVPTKR